MFGRFRKKSSDTPENSSEEVPTPAPVTDEKVEKEISVEKIPTSNEIDEARKDLMRAMESIAISSEESDTDAPSTTTVKEEEIPVIKVTIKRTEPKTAPPLQSTKHTEALKPKPKSINVTPPKPADSLITMKTEEPDKSPEPAAASTEPITTETPAETKELEPIAESISETISVKIERNEAVPTPKNIDATTDVVPVRSEPKVIETQSQPAAVEMESPPVMQMGTETKITTPETEIPLEPVLPEESSGTDDSISIENVTETLVHEPNLPSPEQTTQYQIETEVDIPDHEIIAQIAPETESFSSQITTYRDTESPIASRDLDLEDGSLQSPADPSIPVRRSTPRADPYIAQMDDIMMDIVKQDIATHRKRLAQ